jgi:hypothetical protein
MAKRVNLLTRAFGAEPGVPDVTALADWVAHHRGKSADLHAYLLEQSLSPQCAAGITEPCGGGMFTKDRVLDCVKGMKDMSVVDDLYVDPKPLIEDARRLVAQKKHVWCAMPAPGALGMTDCYYNDKDEWYDAINCVYADLMRAQRDAGIKGHVLISERVDEAAVSSLASHTVFFFQQKPDRNSLETLMEYQRRIAVGKEQLKIVFDLANEYELHQLIVMDPDEGSVKHALLHLDPDQVMAGGYCTDGCDEYWKALVDAAYYTK